MTVATYVLNNSWVTPKVESDQSLTFS